MTQIQMTEMLSTTLCVTADDAQAALEAKEWNLLEAAQLLLPRHIHQADEGVLNHAEVLAPRVGVVDVHHEH